MKQPLPFRALRANLALCFGMLICSSVQALDLMEAYRLAISGDATFQAARATAAAAREAVPQARAGLLPQISASASRSRNSTEQTSPNLLGEDVSRNYDYFAKNASINLRQPLIRFGNLAHYYQAEAQVAAAEATLENDTQMLALKVAGNYFDTLVAREKLESIRIQKEAYAGQLAAAERALQAGFGTRTDIDDAQARLDMAAAQEIEARLQVRVMEKTLAGVVNQRIQAEQLARIDDMRLQLEMPQPDNLEAWISRAEENNPELRAIRHSIEVAERELDKGRAAHLPTLDLVASRSKSDSDSNNTIGNQYLTSSVGVQLTIPIYSGGQVNSVIRQAHANLDKARQQHEAGRRQINVVVAREFGAVEQGIARVKALEQALKSSQQALHSTRKGVQAGTRNSIDVLNALQQLAATQFQLAEARAHYSISRLKLKSAAGALAEQDIADVNRWLAPGTASKL